MATVKSSIENQAYRVAIISASGNTLIADEPEELGGQDLVFPAACTSATLKMYVARKQWDLQQVKINRIVVL